MKMTSWLVSGRLFLSFDPLTAATANARLSDTFTRFQHSHRASPVSLQPRTAPTNYTAFRPTYAASSRIPYPRELSASGPSHLARRKHLYRADSAAAGSARDEVASRRTESNLSRDLVTCVRREPYSRAPSHATYTKHSSRADPHLPVPLISPCSFGRHSPRLRRITTHRLNSHAFLRQRSFWSLARLQ